MNRLVFLLAWHLLLVSMLLNQDACELTELAGLAEHYYVHDRNQSTISFGQFLWQHYADEQHAAQAGHEHLPFHCNHAHYCPGLVFISTLPHHFLPDPGTDAIKPVAANLSLAIASVSVTVWQPPKL